jgi:uncharacterized LabA/DUF88 family protein
MGEEVAMFIDLENLRYGLLNNYGQEPDFDALVRKAHKYGRPSVMKAYADFTEHPPYINRKLQIAGIEAINIPVKRSTYKKGADKEIERIKNAADMVLALDALIEALEADTSGKTKTFLLVAGDRDYVKLTTLLRNKFGQRVIIVGVPGSVSGDLIAAAGGESDNVEAEPQKHVDKHTLKTEIVAMVIKGPAPLRYWTLAIIDQWTQDPRQCICGTAKERRDAIGELVQEEVLTLEEFTDVKKGKIKRVNVNHEKALSNGYIEKEK